VGAASALPSGEVSVVVSGSPVTALAVSSLEQAASSAQAASEQSWAMSLERMDGSPKGRVSAQRYRESQTVGTAKA
jgi:hypothetical protein